MKKITLLICAMFLLMSAQAVELTVNVATAGTASVAIPEAATAASITVASVNTLIVTGTINALDFKYIRDMAALSNLDLSGVISIEAYTGTGGTSGNGSVSEVYFEDALPKSAFYGKASLTNVILPNTLKSFSQYDFSSCTGITKLVVPASVTTWGLEATNTGKGVFEKCANLKTLVFNGTTPPTPVSPSNLLGNFETTTAPTNLVTVCPDGALTAFNVAPFLNASKNYTVIEYSAWLLTTGINDQSEESFSTFATKGGLSIKSAEKQSYKIVNTLGQEISKGIITSDNQFIPLKYRGVVIVQINKKAIKLILAD